MILQKCLIHYVATRTLQDVCQINTSWFMNKLIQFLHTQLASNQLVLFQKGVFKLLIFGQ